MSINETLFADLTIIKGIGPARQQWLRQSFGVRSYADLAELSPDDIEAMLKADGQIARRSAVEEWVAQAQVLSGTAVSRPLLTLPADEFADWHPFASFVVEIQAREEDGRTAATRTAVQHIERDKNATWPGIEREKLCRWIVAQVDEEVQQLAPPSQAVIVPAPQTAVTVPPSSLHVVSLTFRQPPQAAVIFRPERPLPIILCAERPFTLTLTLSLDPPAASDTQAVVKTQLHGRGLQKGFVSSRAVATSYDAPAGCNTLVQELGEFTFSTGQYQMQLTAVLQDSHTPPCYLELPLLQVIE
ncbi:MAG: hypothetical protein R3C62_23190 [Chloroflexota bacterium]